MRMAPSVLLGPKARSDTDTRCSNFHRPLLHYGRVHIFVVVLKRGCIRSFRPPRSMGEVWDWCESISLLHLSPFLAPRLFFWAAPRLPGAAELLAPALLPITGSQEAPSLSLKFPAPRSSQLGIKTTVLN